MWISVVIPTWNRRAWVAEAVGSVLAQEEVPGAKLEVWVVDDGSTDHTAEALQEQFGQRISLLRWQENRGVAAARNAGVSASRGEWIAFLDSDDLWLPAKLRRQWAFTRERGYRITQTEELWQRNGKRVNPRAYHRKPDGELFFPSLDRCLVSPSAVLLHRTLWEESGGFDEGLPACEDYDLWLRIARRHAVGLCPEPLVIKRGGHADQLSRRFWGMDRFRLAALLRLLAEGGLSAAQVRAVVETIERKAGILANGAEKRGRADEAHRYRLLAELARNYEQAVAEEAA